MIFPGYRSFLVTWSAALQIAWNKKSLTCEKSSIPTGYIYFLYTNMAVAKSCENDLLATEMEIVNYFQAAVSK